MPEKPSRRSALVEYLLELANDPHKLQRFREDPKRALSRRTSIHPDDKALLQRGDFPQLRQALGEDVLFILVLTSPAPEPTEKPKPAPKPASRKKPAAKPGTSRRRGSSA